MSDHLNELKTIPGVIIVISVLFAMNVMILNHVSQLRFSYSTHSNANHLVVIQHGLNYPSILNYPTFYFLKQHLSNKKRIQNNDEYMIYLAHSNSAPHLFSFFYHTNSGIAHASLNLANEIYNITSKYPSINKITLIGCSIGGNYIRYTSHILNSNTLYHINGIPFFTAIKPINLITLSSPHFGIGDWLKLPQQMLDFLSIYSPSLTFKELLNIDDDNILNEMNGMHSVFQLYDKVLIFYNSGWDSLVSCQSSAIDLNGNICEINNDYCNQNRDNVFESKRNRINGSVHRIPICLQRNWFQTLMAHAILALSLPPVASDIVDLLMSK